MFVSALGQRSYACLGDLNIRTLLETVIERMADSRVSTFAQMLGLSKSGAWHWLNKGGLPTLPAWLAISLHGGIGLE